MRYSLGIILFVAFVLRVALLVVNLDFMTLPQGGGDALGFERKTWEASANGRGPIADYLLSGSGTLVLLGSYVYDLTGRAPYVLGLMMVLLGVGIVYLAYQASLELWGHRRYALLVAWAAALFPQLMLHSALFLREIPVAFALTAATLHGIRYVKRQAILQVVWFACWVVVGTLFHSGVIFAIPALLLGVMLARPRGRRSRFKFYLVNGASALVLAGAMYAANVTGFGMNKFGGSLDEAVETFEVREARGTMGGSAFPEWMRVRGGASDAWKIPVRYVALLFSPLIPFMVRSPEHLLGLVDAALYLYLFWLLYRHWGAIKQNRPVVVLLVVMLALFLVYALGVSNFGTAIRHRAKMAPLLLILAAGLPAFRRGRRYWLDRPVMKPAPPRYAPT